MGKQAVLGFTPKDKHNIIAKRKFFFLLKMKHACGINFLHTWRVMRYSIYEVFLFIY